MEGWLNFPVKWHIVAPAGTADEWRKVFENWADGPVEITEQFPADRLAEFAARRAVRGEPSANLLLPEFAARYRQEFIDRLWMRGLGAAMVVYILVVLGYFIAVQALRVRVAQVKKQVAGISQSYTNAQQLKAQVGILQEQSNLKYAALDCLKTASDLLPTDVTLTSLILQDGKTLKLRGTAENSRALSDYNEALRTATISGQPLFRAVDPPSPSSRPGGSGLLWSFDAHLNRREIR
jgi:Tfp pilus assembly protein PilN